MPTSNKLINSLQKGFTQFELVVIVGIVAILAVVVVAVVNPSRQLATARDAQRRADLQQILNALNEYTSIHNGTLPPSITTTPSVIGTKGVDLSADLVPTFLDVIPFDPSTGTNTNTNYTIYLDEDGKVVASASSELNAGQIIQISR